LQTEHGLSEREACAAVGLPRSVYQYEPRANRDGPIIKLLLELAGNDQSKASASCSSDYVGWATVGITNVSIAFIAA